MQKYLEEEKRREKFCNHIIISKIKKLITVKKSVYACIEVCAKACMSCCVYTSVCECRVVWIVGAYGSHWTILDAGSTLRLVCVSCCCTQGRLIWKLLRILMSSDPISWWEHSHRAFFVGSGCSNWASCLQGQCLTHWAVSLVHVLALLMSSMKIFV